MLNNLDKKITDLSSWIDKNSFIGWDPYDVKGSNIYLKVQKIKFGILGKVIRKVFNTFIEYFPNLSRKIFNIKPLENAKGIGLILAAYSNLYLKTKDETYLHKALKYETWLINNRERKYSGYNWGYPFDWQSNIFIPKGTPSSVVTYTVGNGFYLLYLATNDEKYLNICKEICDFFVNDLNVTFEDENSICHSYTPIDDYQVHNANLFVGEFLVKVGKLIDNQEWIDRGIKCAFFAIKEQQEEGFLPYWGLSQTEKYSGGKIRTDHYHSGFEIRMLYSIWEMTHIEKIKNSWEKYFHWYLHNMFTKEGIPKLTPASYYPVNIHSIAESILCLSSINTYKNDLNERIEKIIKWAEKEMEYKNGTYAYMIKYIPVFGEYKIKIPMLRWGQAWMFYALTVYLEPKDKNE